MQCPGCNQEIEDGEAGCATCRTAAAANGADTDGAGEATERDAERAAAGSTSAAEVTVTTTGDNNKTFIEIKKTINPVVPVDPVLLDCISDLPPFPLTDPASSTFLPEELQRPMRVLRTHRFLVVNCDDPALSRAAAAALIEQLGILVPCRKLLNFERLAPGMVPSVYQLTSKSIVADREVLIVADAARSERGQPFVDSFFSKAGDTTALDISNSLRTAKLTVICLTASGTPDERQPANAASWTVSYAQYLLRQRFTDGYLELDATIAKQRADGGWSSDPVEFHKQLESLDKAALMEAVGKGGIVHVAAPKEEYPTPEQPLQMAVLYTATFYPNLSPHEFSRVLTALLGKQTRLVPEVVQQKTKDGTFVPVELKRERQIADIWREQSNAVLRECRLITVRETKRGITFSDLGRRDLLRRHFEEEYGLYVHDQFCAAYEHDLLFDPSEQIARDVIAVTLDMVRNYPDQFGVEWMHAIVTAASAGEPEPRVYQRIADLLRPMLEEPALEQNVDGLLKRLMASAQHDVAFELLKKLRFAPRFDAFYWLRQAVDQGPEDVRLRAYLYLYSELKQPARFYPLLHTLEAWLPPADRDPRTYAPSQRAALRLILESCLESTMAFDERLYGAWPSRFPIVAVDAANASANLGLLVRCLLHPGLPAAFGEEFSTRHLHRLIPALVSEWVFILLAPAATKPDGPSAFGPAAVQQVLVTQLVEASSDANGRDLQQAILGYWEEMKNFLAVAPAAMGPEGRARRTELAWKRELVRKLITQFRQTQRESRPPSQRRATA